MATSTREIDPILAAALRAHEVGRLQEAEQGYLACLREHQTHPVALLYLGVLRYDTREYDEAIRLISHAIEIEPQHFNAYNHMGLALLARGEFEEAVRNFEKSLQLKPENPDVLNNLANTLKKMKRLDAAERTFRRILSAAPDHVQAHYNLGLMLFEQHRYEDAHEQFSKTLAIDPEFHRAHHQLGLVAESLGRFEEAAARYLRVLQAVPEHAQAMAALVALRSHPVEEPLLAKAEAMASGESLQEPESFSLAFALAKRFEARADYERAFKFLRLGNERRKRRHKYYPERVTALFEDHKRIFTRDFISRHAAHGSESQRPVFVLGMPRTGTTLTEQILAAHPDIFGAGELQELARVTSRLPMVMQQALGIGVAPYPSCLEHLSAEFMRAMSDYYLQSLQKQNDSSSRVVDKHPFNFMHIGLISVLFPGARIIHCRRNPLDVAVSCYTEIFDLRQDFTTDLDHFAHYYAHYHGLMQHWREVVDAPILEVQYEAFVTDPQTHTRRLIEFCGVPWNEACLSFQQTERPVLTPSRWQVRQPVYNSSIGRWRRYERHLGSLIDALNANGLLE